MVGSTGESPLSRPGAERRDARTRWRRCGASLLAACACLAVAACGSSSKSSSSTAPSAAATSSASGTSSAASPGHAGGSITVLESAGFAGDWPTGLDPATNTNGAADQSQMDAIYGEPFELQPGGKLTPDLATGYKFSGGGKTVTVTWRKGLKFSGRLQHAGDEALSWRCHISPSGRAPRTAGRRAGWPAPR
jgi:ABC-type transport system substrate-binding protein